MAFTLGVGVGRWSAGVNDFAWLTGNGNTTSFEEAEFTKVSISDIEPEAESFLVRKKKQIQERRDDEDGQEEGGLRPQVKLYASIIHRITRLQAIYTDVQRLQDRTRQPGSGVDSIDMEAQKMRLQRNRERVLRDLREVANHVSDLFGLVQEMEGLSVDEEQEADDMQAEEVDSETEEQEEKRTEIPAVESVKGKKTSSRSPEAQDRAAATKARALSRKEELIQDRALSKADHREKRQTKYAAKLRGSVLKSDEEEAELQDDQIEDISVEKVDVKKAKRASRQSTSTRLDTPPATPGKDEPAAAQKSKKSSLKKSRSTQVETPPLTPFDDDEEPVRGKSVTFADETPIKRRRSLRMREAAANGTPTPSYKSPDLRKRPSRKSLDSEYFE